MNRLFFVFAISCYCLIVMPCFAAGTAPNAMKNEPKSIGGMQCGDTPFNRLTSTDYYGRDELSGCSKTYMKGPANYSFNNYGQLYKLITEGKESDIVTFTKKYGKPTTHIKTGNEKTEYQTITWEGSKISISIISNKINMPEFKSDTFIVITQCKDIKQPLTCDYQSVQNQKNKVDQFTKDIGIDFKMWVSDAAAFDVNFQKTLQTVSDNAQSLGLPKPEAISHHQKDGTLANLCLIYKIVEFPAVKNLIFDKVGDISNDLNSLSLIGKSTSISVNRGYRFQDYNAAAHFSVCLSNGGKL